jgi:hypothetical protein
MPMIKTTFSLDEASIAKIRRLARKWQVSKTEAIRRALDKAEKSEVEPSAAEKIAAFRALQRDLRARGVDFDAWQKAIALGRR